MQPAMQVRRVSGHIVRPKMAARTLLTVALEFKRVFMHIISLKIALMLLVRCMDRYTNDVNINTSTRIAL